MIGEKCRKYSFVQAWVFVVTLKVRLWHQHVGKFPWKVHSNKKMSEIYHKLLVAKYRNKWEKTQEAKRRSTVEQRPVHELERVMDVDLFLEIQGKWAEDSPHHLVILHEMFCHAASEGWKEAERIICWGCQQHMPQLNPEASIPAIKLVGPGTSREELLEIYLEVYKLHWLPGSPPGELAIVEEVLAAVPDQPQRREEAPEAWAQPSHGDSHPSKSGRPHQEGGSSVDKSLTMMREVHQKVLSAAMALEGEIGRLSWMRTCVRLGVRLRSQDCHRV